MRTLIIFLLFFAFSIANAAPKIAVGDAAPTRLGLTLAGEELDYNAHEGKIVIVTFWTTWCPPCQHELSILSALREAVPKQQLEIVAVNSGESRKIFREASKSLESTGLTFTHDRRSALSRSLGIKSIPYTLLIDHNGKIKHIHSGFGEKAVAKLVAQLNAMVAELSPQ